MEDRTLFDLLIDSNMAARRLASVGSAIVDRRVVKLI